jgi:16S rRNA (cytosine967-C5)-methyltransferase
VEVTAARVAAAADALRAVLPFAHPADACLRRYFREHRQLGARDRGFVADTVFAVVRHLRLLQTLSGSREPRRLVLAALALLEGRSQRQLEPLLRRGADDDAQWLAQLRASEVQALPLAVQLSLPDWLWERLLASMPQAQAIALARGLLAPAPLDLRVNTLLATRDQVLQSFAREGIACAPTPYSPLGVRLPDKPALQMHALFLEGKVEVQDEASQLLALLVGARRREMVVDFCAGAGGKTLALGAMMHSEGRLYALDTSARRLANLGPRLKRSGLSNVHPELIDSESDRRIRRLDGKIDRVLVDAPCSGLGTLRRNPDLKWRQSPAGLEELEHKQASILARAAQLVKPGGRLVYATCSLLPEENEAIVARFMQAAPGFHVQHAGALLRAQGVALDTGEWFRVTPHEHHMDGFFAAVLERER